MNTVFKIITLATILCAVAPSKAMLSRLGNTVRTAAINRTLITKPFNKGFTCRLISKTPFKITGAGKVKYPTVAEFDPINNRYDSLLTHRINFTEKLFHQTLDDLQGTIERANVENPWLKKHLLIKLTEVRDHAEENQRLKNIAAGIEDKDLVTPSKWMTEFVYPEQPQSEIPPLSEFEKKIYPRH